MNWPRKCYLGARVIVGADDKLLTFARAGFLLPLATFRIGDDESAAC